MTVIELPGGGEQNIETSTTATIGLSYGERTQAGQPFELTYEQLEVTAAGNSPDLSALIGKPITGTIDENGEVAIQDAPEIDLPGADPASLASQTLGLLMIPLPPGGDPEAESWPLERTRSPGGGMTGTTTFTGTAHFTSETEWQGQPARTIVSEGNLAQRGTGTPPGAPSEIDTDFEGESTTTYVWDPARGVVLHAEQRLDMDGTISMQEMALPTTITATYALDLLP